MLLMMTGFCAILLTSSFMFLFGSTKVSFAGSCLIVTVLPLMFARSLQSIVLVQTELLKSYKVIVGASLVFAGVIVLILHILMLSFVNTTLTQALLGRMPLIFLLHVLPLCVSFITAEFIKLDKHCSLNSSEELRDSHKKVKVAIKIAFTLSSFIAALIVNVSSETSLLRCRKPINFKSSYAIPDNAIRVMSYNLLLGHDYGGGRDNSACVADVINTINPDVIAFQETDPLLAIWGGRDNLDSIMRQLEPLGYELQGGLSAKVPSFGVALFSNLKLVSHEAQLLPKTKDSKVPNYAYTKSKYFLKDKNKVLNVVSAHVAYKNWTNPPSNDLVALQMNKLVDVVSLTSNTSEPVILLGDFNLQPNEIDLAKVWDVAKMESAIYPDRKPINQSSILDTWGNLDHIFYKNLKLVFPGRIMSEIGPVSDHLPVTAVFGTL